MYHANDYYPSPHHSLSIGFYRIRSWRRKPNLFSHIICFCFILPLCNVRYICRINEHRTDISSVHYFNRTVFFLIMGCILNLWKLFYKKYFINLCSVQKNGWLNSENIVNRNEDKWNVFVCYYWTKVYREKKFVYIRENCNSLLATCGECSVAFVASLIVFNASTKQWQLRKSIFLIPHMKFF